MRQRHASQDARRAREFEAFVAGAAGRLLHAATLLTAEAAGRQPARAAPAVPVPGAHVRVLGPAARRGSRTTAPASTWPPASRAARGTTTAASAAPARTPRVPLAPLTPQERLILVLRLYEGVAEEQTAALLGLSPERVRAICDRATATLLHPPRGPAPAVPAAKAVPS